MSDLVTPNTPPPLFLTGVCLLRRGGTFPGPTRGNAMSIGPPKAKAPMVPMAEPAGGRPVRRPDHGQDGGQRGERQPPLPAPAPQPPTPRKRVIAEDRPIAEVLESGRVIDKCDAMLRSDTVPQGSAKPI